MANQKNNIVKVPLNGGLNFSKLKTDVLPYNGFNDLNSPIYGDTISPLYVAERKTASIGNDRPYVDENKLLKDKDGRLLMDLNNKKGLKRKILVHIPKDALAVRDENHYVTVNRDNHITMVVTGIETTGAQIVEALPYQATSAAYSEESQHLLFIAEKGYLHVYDTNLNKEGKMTLLQTTYSVDNISSVIKTFYDPCNNWNVISMYEPFGDWDYHKDNKYEEVAPEWDKWKKEYDALLSALQTAKTNSASYKKEYERLVAPLAQYDAWEAESRRGADYYRDRFWYSRNKYFEGGGYDKALEKRARAYWYLLNSVLPIGEAQQGTASSKLMWMLTAHESRDWWWSSYQPGPDGGITNRLAQKDTDYIGDVPYGDYLDYGESIPEARGYYLIDYVNNERSNYKSANGKAINEAKKNWDTWSNKINNLENDIKNKEAAEPTRYRQEIGNPDYFYGRTSESYNFIYDQTTNTIVRKRLNIPIEKYGKGTYTFDADSYIITGIYDMHLATQQQSDNSFTWKENTEDDFVRYRLGVIPHQINISGGSQQVSADKYFFALSYTPKIKFRKRNINASWDVSSYVPDATPTYTCDVRGGQKARQVENVYMSGTGKNGRNPIWVSVDFEKPPKPSNPNEPETQIDFNNFGMCHDLGDSRYTFYSPYLRANASGNCFPGSTDAIKISKTYTNYDVCSSNIFYDIPHTNGELIKRKEAKNIFREVISNGIINNVAVTDDMYSIGTCIETPLSISPTMPVYYRYGRDGGAVVYLTESGRWIEASVTNEVTDVSILNDEYVIIYTASNANCIRIYDGKIKHFAPDWNNRISLVGSPFPESIKPISVPSVALVRMEHIKSDIVFASGINVNYEVTKDPITGYTGSKNQLLSNNDNITFVGYVSNFDIIDCYWVDFRVTRSDVPKYFTSMSPNNLAYTLYGNIELESLEYPNKIVNIPGLFCKVKPSNFGKFYLDNDGMFYNLTLYDGKMYYNYYTSSLMDDIKDLFMVQGQNFAITKSNYIYTVNLDEKGTASLADALINVKGLKFCGAIPEMAIFYSPMDRTLKSFTADHIMKDMQQATLISNVYYTTYNPQTSAIYICTNNGIYVYASNNQYRLPIKNVEEIYFGGDSDRHTYIKYRDVSAEKEISKTWDILFDKDAEVGNTTGEAEYTIVPIRLITRYYGAGNNKVSTVDCIYFRLYSDVGPVNSKITIKMHTLTDGLYTNEEKILDITASEWDKETNTCYVRYQPQQQRSVGFELDVTTECAISSIDISVSEPDTVAISKNSLNM